MDRALRATAIVALVAAGCAPPPVADDPTPRTLDEFKASVQRVLDETGVPGAGIALVRADGLEWTGGIGWADRDARHAVTADTHFRVGSIGNTFIAMALVQLYEDGALDLEATVASLVSDVAIDNPWETTDPVRVRHLLEHTAGFDDAHFNETYVVEGTPDLPLVDVLRRNPASRRVRWRPGTRMAYSDPGYAVAARVLEVVTGASVDETVQKRILTPLEMATTSFPARPEMDDALASGYALRSGPPVVHRPVYLRPSGAMHSSARELGQFVEMLLGWGERGGGYVIDPEYLSNMEWPRTTAASMAGVRSGYGLGIASRLDRPFHVLGHRGGLDGYLSAYGYSPSRDVGYVVLLNGSHAPAALTRLTALAMRYLKRDVDPPADERAAVDPRALEQFEGYYVGANPRHALMGALDAVVGGHTVRLQGDGLTLSGLWGEGEALVPMHPAIFRRERDVAASMVFTTVDGRHVLAGPDIYAERRARWPYDVLRLWLGASLGVAAAAPFGAAVRGWLAWRRGWRHTRGLGIAWTVAALTFSGGVTVAGTAVTADLGVPSMRSWAIYVCSMLYPMLAFALLPLTALAWTSGVGRRLGSWAAAVAAAHVGLAAFLAWWGLIAFRTWTY